MTTGTSIFTIVTDKSDYPPESTAIFTASGVAVGGTATFTVWHLLAGADGMIGTADDKAKDDLSGTGLSWAAVDGSESDLDGVANGVVVTSWYVNLDAANQAFLLTAAKEGGETVSTVFTDAAPVLAIPDSLSNGLLILTGNDPAGTGTGIFPAFVQIQGDGERLIALSQV
jgi:hypothetical protein